MLTVAISGGVIANDTSRAWIENAVGTNVVAIAHKSMRNQYTQLLTKFSGATEKADFNYLDAELAVTDTLLQQLDSVPEIEIVDVRLIMKAHAQEVSNFTIDPVTLTTLPVGDNREGELLVVGVDPQNVTCSWSIEGRFLNATKTDEAIIGDSVSQMMFSPDPHEGITLSDPLVQGIKLQNGSFSIVGVCVDPINNGKVTYVSIEKLQNIIGVSTANIVLVKLDPSAERSSILTEITSEVNRVNSDFSVFELNGLLQENLDFLGSTWSTVMLLPLFTLTSAALCLIGYTMLAVEEQRQEFAVLLAMGTKSETVIAILGVQSVIVLLSSFAIGISLGVIITLMILMPQPVVTSFTVFEITAWLFAALAGMFLLSLWPALKIAKNPILQIMS
jgi:ABC-type lipoprotein release transport system permease subunit